MVQGPIEELSTAEVVADLIARIQFSNGLEFVSSNTLRQLEMRIADELRERHQNAINANPIGD